MPLAPWSVACGHQAQPSCHWCSLVLSSPNRAGGSSLPPSQHPCRPAAWWYHLVHLSTHPGITSPAAVAPLTPTWSCNYKAGQASGSQHNCWGSPVSPTLFPTPPPRHSAGDLLHTGWEAWKESKESMLTNQNSGLKIFQ